ncbi:hypothetical protein JXL83_07435 [candidate division WOR-3 bacterium]|nr:hypothetical protein [candidate division WOR-3 bacterium]
MSGLFILAMFPAISYSLHPEEKALLSSWEEYQKSNPKTVVFEKVSEMTYEFKTELFPFDGIVKVLNVVIDEDMPSNEGYKVGFIETELVGVPEDFFEKHYYSYSIWQRDNTLYFSDETDSWIRLSDLSVQCNSCAYPVQPLTSFFSVLSALFPVVVMIGILLIVFVLSMVIQKKNSKYMEYARKATQRSLEIAEKSIVLNEENNVILKEILEEIKKQAK